MLAAHHLGPGVSSKNTHQGVGWGSPLGMGHAGDMKDSQPCLQSPNPLCAPRPHLVPTWISVPCGSTS